MDAQGISVATLRPLAGLLDRIGESSTAFLAALGITDTAAPNAFVPAGAVDRELDAIASRRGDPAFGLTLAKATAGRPIGLFGHYVWISGTVRDALVRATERWGLVTQRTRLELVDAGDTTILRAVPFAPLAPRGRHLAELPFATLALRTREATDGAIELRAVRFAHPGEASATYREVFGAPVSFDATFDELDLATTSLDLPLAGADPITSAALAARVEELAAPPADPLVERVRAAAAERLDREPTPEVLARALGVSARTLRRHLEARGLSLRTIVDELRRQRADALFAGGSSVKEVAATLGFSEASAFSRAYKRWTGRAPSK